MNNEQYSTPDSDLSGEIETVKLNSGAYIVAIIFGVALVLGGILNLPMALPEMAEGVGWRWFPHYSGITSLIEFTSAYCLFFKKRWVIYLQVFNVISNILVMYILGWSIINISFFVHLAIICFVLIYWRQLREDA